MRSWRRPPQGPMYCRRCGYRLDNLTERRCPECGRRFNPHNRFSYDLNDRTWRGRQRPWVWALVAMTWIAAALFPYLVYRYIMSGYNDMTDMPTYAALIRLCGGAGLLSAVTAMFLGNLSQRLVTGAPVFLYALLIAWLVVAEWLW